jgi:signal transduction histidine kinase
VKAYPSLPSRERTSRTPVVGVAGIDGVTIEFTDTGIGIPADVIDKVFDPFFSTKPKGTGLGLTIAASIVTAHHGDIKMKSSEAAGTTAYLWIPRVQPQKTSRLNTA